MTFTVLPILILVFFYPMLPERVPEYLNLHGEVQVWGRRGFVSVFRLPLMAVDLQALCALMKYGLWQGSLVQRVSDTEKVAIHREEQLKLSMSLGNWFRVFIAIKLGVSSLEVIFFSVERYHFLTTATRATSWAASILGIAGAVSYGYRLLVLNRKLKELGAYAKAPRQSDRLHLHGGIFYYNSADRHGLRTNISPTLVTSGFMFS